MKTLDNYQIILNPQLEFDSNFLYPNNVYDFNREEEEVPCIITSKDCKEDKEC